MVVVYNTFIFRDNVFVVKEKLCTYIYRYTFNVGRFSL